MFVPIYAVIPEGVITLVIQFVYAIIYRYHRPTNMLTFMSECAVCMRSSQRVHAFVPDLRSNFRRCDYTCDTIRDAFDVRRASASGIHCRNHTIVCLAVRGLCVPDALV